LQRRRRIAKLYGSWTQYNRARLTMQKKTESLLRDFLVPPGKKVSLEKDFPTRYSGEWPQKQDAQDLLKQGIEQLRDLQDRLYAQDRYALLLIFQAMDAAGKDSTIEHVMSGVNPQGCQVYSFKQPSAEELDHDYLWRCYKALPERGRIGIFNRSYYEEVLVVRVHPELLHHQRLPDALLTEEAVRGPLWQQRFEQINNFEKHLYENGIIVVKFFLHVSKQEQKERFLKRIDEPEKNWKFSATDVRERAHWDDYMRAYQEVVRHTSTDWAPWHVIPADQKWFTRLAVAATIVRELEKLDLQYPNLDDDRRAEMADARKLLERD
jgi:PPK2 family polyphosphate:nucleotide phosphotransferase